MRQIAAKLAIDPATWSPGPVQRAVTVTRESIGPVARIEIACRHSYIRRVALCNVWRIGDILIDAGFRWAVTDLIAALRDDPPARVLLTHQHEDHIAGLGALRAAFGQIPVFAPRRLAPFIREAGDVPPYRHYFWGSAEPFRDLIEYDPGTVFRTGHLEIEAVETPGHTPHHIAFVVRESNTVYVLSGDLYVVERPEVMWMEASIPDAIASCEHLASLAEEVILLPSHLRPVRSGSSQLRRHIAELRQIRTAVESEAEKLGTSDPLTVATSLWGPPTPYEFLTGGEISKAGLVRAVLHPTRNLPTKPIDLHANP